MRMIKAAPLLAVLLGATGEAHADPGFDDVAFAYAQTASDESVSAQRQSLAVTLSEASPAYIRTTTKDVQLAATGAAWSNDLPVPFFFNLIRQESSFRPFVTSRAGAQGIAQFMPSVASWRGLQNPFEPESALIEAARYLAELRTRFGNLGLAAAAYNAGPGRLRAYLQHQRALPAETRHYVFAITGMDVDAWRNITDRDFTPPTATAPIETPASATPAAAENTAKASGPARPARHGMPQPHQFAMGKPVAPEILRSERAVLARNGWKMAASR